MNSFQESPLSTNVRQWVVKALGPGTMIVSVSKLLGSTSSSLYSIEIMRNKKRKDVVLRLLNDKEWLLEEADLALHEAASLEWASHARVSTPKFIAVDEKGDHCGVPAVLMSKLTGYVQLQPKNMAQWLERLAVSLARIHEVDPPNPSQETYINKYFTYNDITLLHVPEWSDFPDRWDKVIKMVRTTGPNAKEHFIHRDFHPANVLWENDQVSGIVDWINACRGPAGIDVGHCRLNLALLYGTSVADRFLDAYLSEVGTEVEYHPYWDLLTLIECLPGPPDVYRGWIDFGINHLTNEIMKERIDHYMLSLLKRFA